MNDDDVMKLVAKLTTVVATKEDLKNFATKDDLKGFATKEDLKNFATKEDIQKLKTELKTDLARVENEIKSVGQTLASFIDEIDPKVEDHEKRLKKIESIPSITQQIKTS